MNILKKDLKDLKKRKHEVEHLDSKAISEIQSMQKELSSFKKIFK